jgi:hypothetical protein
MRLSSGRARLALLALALVGAGCRERAARFMGVDAAVAPPEPRAEEPSQVHFTYTSPTSATFSWRGNNRSMRIWAKSEPPRTIEARVAKPGPFSMAGTWQEAEVTDLRPDTQYAYEVGRPRQPVPTFFRSPPEAGKSGFGFAAITELGASLEFKSVRPTHRLVAIGEPAFVLVLGGLTFADLRAQTSVDRHFEDAMAWSRSAAYLPVWSEHEWASPKRDDLRNYKGRFALPNAQASVGAPPEGCCGEDWWWLDFGNVRFVSYPEPYTDATWDEWAEKAAGLFAEAEAAPTTELVVTVGHRPAYSSGLEGGDARLRKILDGFGARFPKYVLNLSGHAGVYERTKPQAHVVHITVPPGGGDLVRADTSCGWKDCKAPAFTAFRALHRGMLRFSSQPRALKVEAFCSTATPGRDDVRCVEGEILDSYVARAPEPAVAGAKR